MQQEVKDLNYAKLKGVMKEHNITQAEMASILGISIQAFNAKINGKKKFTLDEASIMKKKLNIVNTDEIFFNN